MNATTIERLKHAQEVLGWMADGKEMQWLSGDEWLNCSTNVSEGGRVGDIMRGYQYRLKPAKTIRPFTEQEARRLVGCVLVNPSNGGSFVLINNVYGQTLFDYADKRWHYHLPGDPDNLKPCWVEE